MLQLKKGDRVVLATHNEGKRQEMAALLLPFGIKVESAADYALSAPDETAPDFIGNAAIKSQAVAQATNHIALADDSGLAIDALDGAPGIHSARWAQNPEDKTGARDFAYAMAQIEKKLADVPEEARTARFICALSLSWWEDGQVHTAPYEGRVEGRLVFPPRGTKGFGYDPIFCPLGHKKSFGEMPPTQKHALSHRADAFALFCAAHIAPSL